VGRRRGGRSSLRGPSDHRLGPSRTPADSEEPSAQATASPDTPGRFTMALVRALDPPRRPHPALRRVTASSRLNPSTPRPDPGTRRGRLGKSGQSPVPKTTPKIKNAQLDQRRSTSVDPGSACSARSPQRRRSRRRIVTGSAASPGDDGGHLPRTSRRARSGPLASWRRLATHGPAAAGLRVVSSEGDACSCQRIACCDAAAHFVGGSRRRVGR
jgi:hypothetical protein